MGRKKKTAPVFWLRSKLGRPFWRFGVHLSADSYTRFEVIPSDDPRAALSFSARKGYVTESEARAIEPELKPIREGGVLDITSREPEPDKVEDDPAPQGGGGEENGADA